MSALEMLEALQKFNDLSDREKNEFTLVLSEIVDAVASGVWDKQMTEHCQCHFCCRSPHSEHQEWCVVELAKKFKNNFAGDYLRVV